tara:strand:- start:326 stop:535 length:210 start_codon:yes stop_codon:yes gene_type:complete
MIEDKWINFVLLNGWRLKAEVDEATGDLVLLIANEQGKVGHENTKILDIHMESPKLKEIKEVYKLSINE